MRVSQYVIAAVLIGVWSAPAAAQTSASPQPVTQQGATTAATYAGTVGSHWVASGVIGSSFGLSTTDASIDFGGQLAYLWGGVFGAEFLASYTPTFQVDNIFLADDPHVFSYMANAIAAIPLGAEGRFQPYASGGFGRIQMQTSILNAFLPTATPLNGDLLDVTGATQSAWGWNLGAGVMAFVGNVGFRGDIRYYQASDNADTVTLPADALTDTILSGVEFWRANAGVALRW
jgi:opacity protein-like surface antigen